MGQDSVKKDFQDDIFLLDTPSNITLDSNKNKKFLWIDARIYNGENQKYFSKLREKFRIQCFTSLEGARTVFLDCDPSETFHVLAAAALPEENYTDIQNQPRFQTVTLFCQTSTRADLLMQNFSKIKSAQYSFSALIQSMETLLASSATEGGINALFMIQENTNLINRYRLNYACLCKEHSEDQAKKDFLILANKLFPKEAENIKKFENQFDLKLPEAQKHKIIFKWCFSQTFFWKMITSLPKVTTDPKKLAYLRLVYRYLNKGIKKSYDEGKKQKKLFIVQTLSDSEIDKIEQQQFIIFPTFIKGYTNQKLAYQQMSKNQKSILFQVIMTNLIKMDPQLDFGYYVDQTIQDKQNVIFNIYNFFTFDQVDEHNLKVVNMFYGSLSSSNYKRKQAKVSEKDNKEKRQRLKHNQEKLLRNYDYLQDLMKKINSQAAILQMQGKFKQSLDAYRIKSSNLSKSSASTQVIDKYYLEIGDGFRINQEYDSAEQEYKKIQSDKYKLISRVHLLEVYSRRHDNVKFKALLQQLKGKVAELNKLPDREEEFKVRSYLAIALMNEGKYKQANASFRNIMMEMTVYYDYKYQGIPLVHDILRNVANCQSKLKNYSEAISLLNSTKQWQVVCQGKSPNVALTQTFIQQVYVSKGDQTKIAESEKTLTSIRKNFLPRQQEYINRSRVMINLNESAVNINLSDNQATNIKQSAVNINFD